VEHDQTSNRRRFLAAAQTKAKASGDRHNGLNYNELASELGLSVEEAIEITRTLKQELIVESILSDGDFILTELGLGLKA